MAKLRRRLVKGEAKTDVREIKVQRGDQGAPIVIRVDKAHLQDMAAGEDLFEDSGF